jgi:DNA adenine methylase
MGLGLIKYPGGKGRLWRWIVQYLPKSDVYCEAFGGAAHVLLNKEPSPLEIYNDIDGNLVNLFRVVADPKLFRKFLRRVQPLLYARSLYKYCARTLDEQTDPVERAWRWYVMLAQGYPARMRCGWAYDITSGGSSTATSWARRVDKLQDIHARLRHVQIEQLDWRACLERYDQPGIVWYLDPPYPPEVCKHTGIYNYELTSDEHAELVSRILKLKGMVAISSYPNKIYAKLKNHGWREVSRQAWCHVALIHRKRYRKCPPRTEVLYLNPACVQALEQQKGERLCCESAR